MVLRRWNHVPCDEIEERGRSEEVPIMAIDLGATSLLGRGKMERIGGAQER